jgi:hypothetical protein
MSRHRSVRFFLFLITIHLLAWTAQAQDCTELSDQARYLGANAGREYLAAAPVGDALVAAISADGLLVTNLAVADGPPLELFQYPVSTSDQWLAAQGNTVYVSGSSGVQILEILPGGEVVPFGHLSGQETAAEVKAQDGLLAVVHDGAWSLWDCSTTTNPTLLSRTEYINSASSMAGSHIAVGSQRVALNELVYDITDPANPLALADLPAGYSDVHGLEIAGDRLYEIREQVSDGGSWIYGDRWFFRSFWVSVLDLASEVGYPELTTHTFAPSSAMPLSAPDVVLTRSGQHILAGQTADASLLILDTTEPFHMEPRRLPVAPTPALAYQLDKVVGLGDLNWAWEVPETMDRGAIAVSNLGVGQSGYGTWYTQYRYLGSDAAGDLLAVGVGSSESDGQFFWEDLTHIYLFQPVEGSLQPVSNITTWGGSGQIALVGDHVLLAEYGLQAADISDPANPGEVFSVPDVPSVRSLVTLGDGLVLLGHYSGGLMSVWDLNDINAPVEVVSFTLASTGLMVVDGNLVLAELPSTDQVAVLDLSDPAAPVWVKTIDVPGDIRSLACREGQVVALTSDNYQLKLAEFDHTVMTPTVDVAPVPMSLNEVAWHGEQVFFSGQGLHGYQPATDEHLGSVSTSHPFLGVVSFDDALYAVTAENLVDMTLVACGDGTAPVPQSDFPGVGHAGTIALDAAPNPFNPSTAFSFTLSGEAAVELALYDIKGRRVRDLVSEVRAAGRHTVQWNGRDDQGRLLASGVYFARLLAGDEHGLTRVMLLK